MFVNYTEDEKTHQPCKGAHSLTNVTCLRPFYNHYLPTRRIGRGPNLSIRIPSGRVVALSKKDPMVKPRFSISSWSTQLSHSSTSPPEELFKDTSPDSFTVGGVWRVDKSGKNMLKKIT